MRISARWGLEPGEEAGRGSGGGSGGDWRVMELPALRPMRGWQGLPTFEGDNC